MTIDREEEKAISRSGQPPEKMRKRARESVFGVMMILWGINVGQVSGRNTQGQDGSNRKGWGVGEQPHPSVVTTTPGQPLIERAESSVHDWRGDRVALSLPGRSSAVSADVKAPLGRGTGTNSLNSSESLSSCRLPTGVSILWLIMLLWSIILSNPRSMTGVPGVTGRGGVVKISEEDP